MSQQTRRSFLRHTTCGTAAALSALAVPAVQARGANERFVVGMIGCSNRGVAIGQELRKQPTQRERMR